VPTLEDAVRRVWEVALPQEDARIKSIGGHGSHVGKMVMFHSERPGRIRMLLIGEQLGF
jgi:hypothetical protein